MTDSKNMRIARRLTVATIIGEVALIIMIVTGTFPSMKALAIMIIAWAQLPVLTCLFMSRHIRDNLSC